MNNKSLLKIENYIDHKCTTHKKGFLNWMEAK